MKDPVDILQSYWGFTSFRSYQAEAIQSVLDGNDTLLILPTGGGKSLCYQIPAIVLGGITLVVSPLIALMEDQVQQLKNRGIQAACWHSGLSQREQDLVLNNVSYTRDYMLLYISPERLNSLRFQQLVPQIKVNLIAVDEAHCISQWGYNFRPAYLKIGENRDLFPDVPMIALTATATDQVAEDIKEKLILSDPLVFRQSIVKDNLSLYVYEENDKHKFLINYVLELKGSGLIYIRNRASTEAIAKMLSDYDCSCGYYHGGMDIHERTLVQEKWVSNEYQFIVATNAFGMGIDKDDVRWIIHMSPPSSIEEYYQEIGRAGRDGEFCKSYLLWCQDDLDQGKEQIESKYPSAQTLIGVLRLLVDHFQIPVSTHYVKKYFNFQSFVNSYPMSYTKFHYAFALLDKLGVLNYSEPRSQMASIMVNKNKVDADELAVNQPKLYLVLNYLMRTYTNIFWSEIQFKLSDLAFDLNLEIKDLEHRLSIMKKMEIIHYFPEGDYAVVEFPEGRPILQNISLDHHLIKALKDRESKSWENMLGFVANERCKFVFLQNFFSESNDVSCDHCDSDYHKLADQGKGLEELYHEFKLQLEKKPQRVFDLIVHHENEYLAKESIRFLYRKKQAIYKDGLLYLNT